MATHAHAHAPGQDHSHAESGPGALRVALIAAVFVTILELAGGIYSRSLALLADSAHVFMDVVAILIAMAAAVQAARPATARRTYGYARFEILAALLNGGLLFAATIAIAIEAVQRLAHPELPEGKIMMIVAGIGVIVNVGVGVMLARGGRTDLNTKAVLLHVGGDALGSLGVIIAGALILSFGWLWADPVLSLVVAAIILFGVYRVVRQAADVLLESAPDHASPAAVRTRLCQIEGVNDVHDLHVWSIGSDKHVLTAHVLLTDKTISEATAILREIEETAEHDFSINHVTVQFECVNCAADGRILCTQAAIH
jgi:cobalt-zinc-cadmium efflux system protein